MRRCDERATSLKPSMELQSISQRLKCGIRVLHEHAALRRCSVALRLIELSESPKGIYRGKEILAIELDVGAVVGAYRNVDSQRVFSSGEVLIGPRQRPVDAVRIGLTLDTRGVVSSVGRCRKKSDRSRTERSSQFGNLSVEKAGQIKSGAEEILGRNANVEPATIQ